jgi:hypothetical protein
MVGLVATLAIAGCGSDDPGAPSKPNAGPNATLAQVAGGDAVGNRVSVLGQAYLVNDHSLVLSSGGRSLYVTGTRGVTLRPGERVRVTGLVQELDDVQQTRAVADLTGASVARGASPAVRRAMDGATASLASRSYIQNGRVDPP